MLCLGLERTYSDDKKQLTKKDRAVKLLPAPPQSQLHTPPRSLLRLPPLQRSSLIPEDNANIE